MAAGLRLRKKRSGERGPDAVGKERAHRRVSRAADSKVELTMALDRARARQRPRNRQWSSAGGGEAPCTRGQSERVWQRAQMSKGRWASRARGSKGARAQGRGKRTRGRGRVHGGEIVGERLGTIDRWGRRDSERARGKRTAPTARPHRAARERERGSERARVGTDRRGPPVRHRRRAGTSARAGWA
jgi:hypothetical protein